MPKAESPETRPAHGKLHLCIGTPRAGMTWLYEHLAQLSPVFVPPVKEVRFWYGQRSDTEIESTYENALARIKPIAGQTDQQDWLKRWRRSSLSGEKNLKTYLDLMSVQGKVSIDVSPTYCLMPKSSIIELFNNLPSTTKLLLVLRDPIDRSISQLNLHFHLHGNFRGEAPLALYEDELSKPQQVHRNDYASIFENWTEVFGERLKVLFYEDMKADPAKSLSEICHYLGVRTTQKRLTAIATAHTEAEHKKNQASTTPDFSRNLKTITARHVIPSIERLRPYFPDQAKKWLGHAKLYSGREVETARVRDVSEKALMLMRMTENLGDNSEYAFWQRDRGYEPTSLFRWARTRIEPLINFLQAPGELYRAEDLSVHSVSMVSDGRWEFKFNSKLIERCDDGRLQILSDQAKFTRIYEQEQAQLNLLRYKFFAQARSRPAVYVFKSKGDIPEELAMKLGGILSKFHPLNKLVCITRGNSAQIERIGDYLYFAEIPNFASYIEPDQYAPDGWTELMEQLSDRGEISEIIARMR